MDANGDCRVVLTHDWLTGMRGGEKVLEVMCECWPEAPLFTLLHRRGSVSPAIEQRAIQASFLQWLPGSHRYYRYLLPLMPRAAAGWQVPDCDAIFSSSHCVAKSVQPPDHVPHICYCHTPMRYAWHMQSAYFAGKSRGLKERLVGRLLARLREWDRQTSDRVTHFIANSRTVQRRIQECYGRSSIIIHPPADTDFFRPAPVAREDYYLIVSAFAPYKRLDLAVEACNRLKRKLVVIGMGQDEKRVRRLAGSTIAFLGWQSDEAIRGHLQRSRALLFPGEEDFGIVPVEAQACSCPVIAYGRGGATETVIPLGKEEPTGLWFEEQTVDCLMEALNRFESRRDEFSPEAARRHAEKFNRPRFASAISTYLNAVVENWKGKARKAA